LTKLYKFFNNNATLEFDS